MRFFRHGWGGGSVKIEAGRGEIFKMQLKMGIGGGGGGGIQFLAHGTKGEEIYIYCLFFILM